MLVPTGALGLGWDERALEAGLDAEPDAIVVDGGSTDSGPHYLGTGTSKYSRATTKAEWASLMAARAKADVPLVIGSAGTCGADDAVDWLLDITREIAAERGEAVRVAALRCGQTAADMRVALTEGRMQPLDPAPAADDQLLKSCTNIVALAGAEQIRAALETGADIVVAGRTSDTASIAALPLARGCHPGAAWHGAKIGECGAFCTTRPGTGSVLLDFDGEGFAVSALGEGARATPGTVAAHMLYENADPFVLLEPGGHLDVRAARYDAQGERSVRVTGSRWVRSERYTVKLEGARRVGYQTVSLVLVREPAYVARIREWCESVERRARARIAERMRAADCDFELRRIGLDATLGALDRDARAGTEVGVMAIVTADTQERAREVAKLLNPLLLHHGLDADAPDPTFAFPFSPPEMDRGPVHEFCLNHTLELDDPMQAFRLQTLEFGP